MEFVPLPHVAVDELADFAAQACPVPEVVNADHRQIGNGFLRLFRILPDDAVLIEDDHTELAGVFNALHEEVAIGRRIEGEIGAEQGVGKGHDRLAFEQVLGAPHGVRRAQRLLLMADVSLGAQRFGEGEEVGFHLRSEVADDEGDVVEGAGGHGGEVLHQPLNDGLAGHVHQRFGHGQRVGTEAAAAARHGDDEVHSVPVCPKPPAPRSVMARSAGWGTGIQSTRA